MNENTYTSFDFMKIFGIKKGSWQNIKNKYNLDQYSEKILEGKQTKFVYNQQAYEILKENYQKKLVKEVKENPRMFSLIQENETLKATLEEYKTLNSKFENMYREERNTKENLLVENATLSSANGAYIEKNHKLEEEKYNLSKQIEELQNENNKLKNRGLLARIFNK